MKKNNVKNQWNKAAEGWVDFVRTGKDWTRNELNNPAMFRMLGNIRGKRVLDLGCGEGHNTRMLASRGARVIGVDFSEKMIALAIQEEKRKKLGIDYHISDACRLRWFKNSSFDIVACFMALQDIEHYQGAINEVFRVLRKGGRFVFAIPHPCFEVRVIGGKWIGGWVYSRKPGVKDKETALNEKLNKIPLYYTVDRYFNHRCDIVNWNMKRLAKHFKTTSFHRTLTDYATALARAGFLIARIDEPKPTKRGLSKYPEYFKGNLRIPHSIVIEAIK
jgi:ubiquinone/menaquinone biosynthesis C-methylase UbiE